MFNYDRYNKESIEKKHWTFRGMHSLRVKLTLTLTILITLTIFIFWVINQTFLEDYYLHKKVNTLNNAYAVIEELLSDKKEVIELTSDEALKIEKLSEQNNFRIYVIGRTFNMVYPGTERDNDVNESIYDIFKTYYYSGSNPDVKKITLVESKVDYSIFLLEDRRLEYQSLDLIGSVNGNFDICIRANYESMKESVSIANEFFLYIGIGVILLGIAIMFYISKKFTEPILQLSNLAKHMSDLNFDVKHEIKSNDEIGELGHSINILSEKLEQTISELKSANNELLTDLANKTQIDEMRKDFLSNVTHELKTPIALIQGYAEGLKDNITEDEESKEFYCEVIIDEANKMNTMVKKLLSLNQIESGHNQVNITRFDLVQLIRSVLNSTDILFKQKGTRLVFEAKEALYVWSDEYLIEEVLTNYISNALNHVEGSNIIEIILVDREESIRVAIYNTGKTIAEEDLENIWVKFYKVDKARTREYGGNGIGLSIVKAIMTSLNQSYGVVNHLTGVEFWFEVDKKVE